MLAPNLLPKRIEIIQSLRGLASVGVMFAHLWHQQDAIIIQPTLKKLSKAGAYGVHVFFVLSGFILLYSLYQHSYKVKSYFRFILRRLIRLEPAYIVSILTVLFFALVLGPALNVSYESHHRGAFDLLLHLLYLVPFYKGANWVQGVNWTLAIEFQFYILVGLLAALLIRKEAKKYVLHIALLLVSAASFLYLERTFFLTWLTFFSIGMTVFLMVVEKFNKLDFLIQFIPAAIINYFIFDSPYLVMVLFLTPLLIYFFLEKKNLPFQFLGKISYSVYLVHGTIGIFTTRFCVDRMDVTLIRNQLFILVLSMSLSLLLSWVFYLLFEKPFTKLSKKVRI